ncbi:MAG: hypothetical protein ACI84C_002939 [Flavobacteriales bacterium]|jgi:uncharacterized protein
MNEMQKSQIDQTRVLVESMFSGEGTGHDWWHIVRVRNMAITIAEEEKADMFVTEMGAYLHDIADHKFHNGDDTAGPKKAREWLDSIHLPQEQLEAIVSIVDQVTFKGAGVETKAMSIEAQCVQDADRLDALGAVGIARTFAYGGSKNREIYNPAIPPVMHDSFEAYKSSIAPTINHFYEKLLLLKDLMNTATGRRLGEARHQFMVQYLEQFYSEWAGKS